MSRADNTAQLRRAAADRHDAAISRTVAAIRELDRTTTTVTITSVAAAARVSRSWLYQQPDLLQAATQLRDRAAPASTPQAQRATDESLRQRLTTANTEIRSLRDENAGLREQLARALGEQRIRR